VVYGHVMRREDEHVKRRVLEMKVEGVEPEADQQDAGQIASPKT